MIFKRIIAFYIDCIIFGIISFVITISLIEINGIQATHGTRFNLWIYLASYILYFLLMEYKFRTTLGKFIFKIGVSKGSFKENIVRTLFRLIPFDLISFLFYDDKLTWHERFSNVHTIPKRVVS